MAKDPVCGMEVEPTTAPFRARYQEDEYWFCSSKCRDAFLLEPEKYTGQRRREAMVR